MRSRPNARVAKVITEYATLLHSSSACFGQQAPHHEACPKVICIRNQIVRCQTRMPVQFQVNSHHTFTTEAFAGIRSYPEWCHTTIGCEWQGPERRQQSDLCIGVESARRLRRHCASHAQGNIF